MKTMRIAALFISFTLIGPLSGCSRVLDAIDQATGAIDKSVSVIRQESGAWRNELPQLTDALTQAAKEAQAQGTADAESVIANATNSLRSLTEDTIKLSGLTVEQLTAKFGAEVRCNLDFAQTRVAASLVQLSEALKFWKKNKKLPPPVPHSTCSVTPDRVELSAATQNGTWTMTSPTDKIVGIYGYDFNSGALPSVELRNANDEKVRDSGISVAYVTRYQINLNFGSESFGQLAAGFKYVLQWPDKPEPTAVSVILIKASKLKITAVDLQAQNPRARADLVAPVVEVTNEGGQPSGNFTMIWTPGPDMPVRSQPVSSIGAGDKRQVRMPAFTYQRAGRFEISVNAGNQDSWRGWLNVTPYANTPGEVTTNFSGEWPNGGGERGQTKAFPELPKAVQLGKDCEVDTSRGGGSFEVEDIDKKDVKYTVSFPAGYNFDFRENTFWRSIHSLHAQFDPTPSPRAEGQVTLKGLGGHGVFGSRGPERFNVAFTVYTLCPS